MDLSAIDKVELKLGLLFERINSLKTENRGLKQEVYSLRQNLEQARSSSTGNEEMQKKFGALVAEREKLIMEREMVRQKVKGILKKVDQLASEED